MAKSKPATAIKEPELSRLKLGEIMPWDGNPREHDAEQLRILDKSFDAFGLGALPIVQKGTNKLIAGHGRLLALKKRLPLDAEIPVLVMDVTDQEAVGYALADNKIQELSTWNIPALRAAIAEIDDGAFDMEATGWTPEALQDLFPVEEPDGGLREGADPDDAPACPEIAFSRLGDLWLLGRHRLLCGDATDALVVDRLMDGTKADLVLTDPPYGVAYESSSKALKGGGKASIMNDALQGEQFQVFLDAVFANYARAASKTAPFYVFYPSRFHAQFELGMLRAGVEVRAQIIWVKNAASFGFAQYKWKHEPVLFGAKTGEVPLIHLPQHETAFYAFKSGSAPFLGGDKTQTTVWQCARERDYVHPCLTPDSLVMTAGGYRPIGTLGLGDLVLGHDGVFHPVIATTSHHCEGPIYRIAVEGTNLTVDASDNHPFLVARPQREKTRLAGFDIGWVRADEMTAGDYVLSPRPPFGEEEPISLQEAFLYGLFVAEGTFQKAGHGSNVYPVFHLHRGESDLIGRISDLYGASVKVYPDRENGAAVMVFLPELGDRLMAFCGKGAAEKTLSASIWSWTRDLVESFLAGYLAGDGALIRTYHAAKTVSPDLASQICHLADGAGFRSTLYRCEAQKGGIGGRLFRRTRPFYHLILHPDSKLATLARRFNAYHPIQWEGHAYWLRRVKSVTPLPYSDVVVNLTVDGCHTFQTAVGMSHNTQKPVELLRKAICNGSRPKAAVLDFFGGSGSTLIACEDTGRQCYSLELDPKFADVIVRRWEEATGKKATLVRDGKEIPAALPKV